jgi:CBS domain-containing protein
MNVGLACTRQIDLADPHESVQAAASRMNARNVGTLVVTDGRSKPVGLITDRDLTIKVLAAGKDGSTTTVYEVMSHHPETVLESATLEEAIAKMKSGPFRRLPVVDENGKLVGILSLDDVLSLMADEFGQIGRLIGRESPTMLARY